MSVSCKEFAKNNTNYIYDLYLTEKLAKQLMVGGKSYKVQKYILRAFKNLKLIVFLIYFLLFKCYF